MDAFFASAAGPHPSPLPEAEGARTGSKDLHGTSFLKGFLAFAPPRTWRIGLPALAACRCMLAFAACIFCLFLLTPFHCPPHTTTSMLDIAALCLVVTALLTYLNHRFTRLPMAIGVMVIALALSLVIVLLDAWGVSHALRQYEESFLRAIDFSDVLMQGMLSFLLFAGALHIDLQALKRWRLQVGALALVGTLLSTLLIGTAMWLVLPLLGMALPFLYCMLFGALISPTDPIAVIGILQSAQAPKDMELVIAGESLFNDGVGVVIFALLAGMLASGSAPSASTACLRPAGDGGGRADDGQRWRGAGDVGQHTAPR